MAIFSALYEMVPLTMSRRILTEKELKRETNRTFEDDWSDEEVPFHCENSSDESYSPTDSDTEYNISTHDCSIDDETVAN